MPRDWDKGAFSLRLYWIASAAGAGSVVWEAACIAHTDNSIIDSAWQTVTTNADVSLGAGRQHITASFSLNPNVSPSSLLDAYTLRLRIKRIGADAGDTYASTAWLTGAKIFYKKNGNLLSPLT